MKQQCQVDNLIRRVVAESKSEWSSSFIRDSTVMVEKSVHAVDVKDSASCTEGFWLTFYYAYVYLRRGAHLRAAFVHVFLTTHHENHVNNQKYH